MKSIAILPFVNATAVVNNEYLSDGLTESLIGTLSQLPNLKVMARSTVFRYKGNLEDPQKIGQALQVSAVLMGRITQHGDQVGVQTDLVNTADGAELWGAQYSRKLDEITQLQSDITRDISAHPRRQLSGREQERLGRAGTTNPEAHRLYLEARQLWHRGACAQRAFDRGEPEEGRWAGCAGAGAAGPHRSAAAGAVKDRRRASAGGSDGDLVTSRAGLLSGRRLGNTSGGTSLFFECERL